MKVFLKKDVEKVGLTGEIIKVTEGYARNFLFPRELAVEVTSENEDFYKKKLRIVENRKAVVETKTSMLAERIGSLKLKLKRKMHDDGKLYGAVSPIEIVDLLAKEGVNVSKNQVVFNKSIKEKGTFDVIIKLSSRLQPKIVLNIIPE